MCDKNFDNSLNFKVSLSSGFTKYHKSYYGYSLGPYIKNTTNRKTLYELKIRSYISFV